MDSKLDSGSGQASRSQGAPWGCQAVCVGGLALPGGGLFSQLPLQGARMDISAPTVRTVSVFCVHERVGKGEPKGAWQVSAYLLQKMQVWLHPSVSMCMCSCVCPSYEWSCVHVSELGVTGRNVCVSGYTDAGRGALERTEPQTCLK